MEAARAAAKKAGQVARDLAARLQQVDFGFRKEEIGIIAPYQINMDEISIYGSGFAARNRPD